MKPGNKVGSNETKTRTKTNTTRSSSSSVVRHRPPTARRGRGPTPAWSRPTCVRARTKQAVEGNPFPGLADRLTAGRYTAVSAASALCPDFQEEPSKTASSKSRRDSRLAPGSVRRMTETSGFSAQPSSNHTRTSVRSFSRMRVVLESGRGSARLHSLVICLLSPSPNSPSSPQSQATSSTTRRDSQPTRFVLKILIPREKEESTRRVGHFARGPSRSSPPSPRPANARERESFRPRRARGDDERYCRQAGARSESAPTAASIKPSLERWETRTSGQSRRRWSRRSRRHRRWSSCRPCSARCRQRCA